MFDDHIGHNILFVTFDDCVYGLGSNSEGQLGLGHNKPVEKPVEVSQLCHKNIHQFINGWDFVLAVNTDNNVIFSFGCNDWGQLGRDVDRDGYHYHKPDTVIVSTIGLIISQISCGKQHTIVLTTCGQLLGWVAIGCDGQVVMWGMVLAKSETNNISNNFTFENSFDVITKLGEGGYGQVYKVQNKCDEQYYALKICPLEGLTEKEKQNVLKETQSLVKLRSEFVIEYNYS
ncbi:unnamed protein product [Oppiella nova]|uniref:Protein kinase domain-containing protein n=1 Tax=Oppiella nova TaxID=334625 RepID=A0A7R9LWC5_9ACAR|nr:unnamed protein product [Oppiella nova]CAG2167312.1 unnamed protein product [Oppiella nova]